MNKKYILVAVLLIGGYILYATKKTLDTAGKNLNVSVSGVDVFFNRMSVSSLPGRLRLELSNPSSVVANVQRIYGNITAGGVQVGTFSAGAFTISPYAGSPVNIDFSLSVIQLATATGINWTQIAAGKVPALVARGVIVVGGVDVPFEYKTA